MEIRSILNLLDRKTISELGETYAIDKANNKITGEFILISFLRCILLGRPLTLRSIEHITNRTPSLSVLLKTKDENNRIIDHSSIGKRLNNINPNYFRSIYEDIVNKYNKKHTSVSEKAYHIFDSTIISLSGKLLKDGLNFGGKETDRHIKVSIGIKKSIPSSIRFCNTLSESSEDIALIQAIREAKITKEDVLLFDRGISKTLTYVELCEREQKFVTRVRSDRWYKCVQQNHIKEQVISEELRLVSDEIVHLYSNKKLVKCDLRLVKCINRSTNEELVFLTNLVDVSAAEVAALYKHRWEIEVFFKFIKQHLQIKHFICHSTNGMMVYMYVILIAAVLFTLFKKIHNLTGFKMALLDFILSLEKEMVRDIVILCRGDPSVVDTVLL